MNNEQVPDGVNHTYSHRQERVCGTKAGQRLLSNVLKISPPFTATHTALIKGIRPVVAEGIFGWGCKHLPRAPRQHGPPGARALPHFYNALFSDIGVFFKLTQSSPQFVFVETVQTQ